MIIYIYMYIYIYIYNRLVTSVGELTLGPFPCQLSPGGDVFST